MPTLAAMMLGDAARKSDTASTLQDLSDRELRTAPGFRTKRKKKSLVIGKGGPGSGPQGGSSMTPEQIAAVKASGRAAYATEGAKTAIQHALAFGFHEKAAAANARAGNHDAATMHERAAGFHKSEARRLSSFSKRQLRKRNTKAA